MKKQYLSLANREDVLEFEVEDDAVAMAIGSECPVCAAAHTDTSLFRRISSIRWIEKTFTCEGGAPTAHPARTHELPSRTFKVTGLAPIVEYRSNP